MVGPMLGNLAGNPRTGRPGATRTAAAILLLIILAAGVGFGQDRGSGPATPRRVLLLVSQADGAGFDADGLSLVSRSILLGLQTDPDVQAAEAVIVDSAGQSVPGSDDARTEASRAGGADAWLWVEVSRTAEGTSLRVRSFDVARDRQTIDQTLPISVGLSPLDLPAADWTGVARLVARAYPPLRADAEGPIDAPASALLSIHARPGSLVKVGGGPAVTIGADGSASVTLAVPAEYSLRATAPGFSPATRQLFLTADREVTLRQDPGARWAVEASLADLAWPGLGLSWFIVPDSLLLGIDATTYLLGLALNQEEVLLSLPLTNVILKIALYVAPSDSPFRPYTGLAVFLRVVHAPIYLGLDPLSPVGGQLILGAEMGRTLRGGFFLEYLPTLYSTTVANLFRATLGVQNPPLWWYFSSAFAVNFLAFSAGYRWTM